MALTIDRNSSLASDENEQAFFNESGERVRVRAEEQVSAAQRDAAKMMEQASVEESPEFFNKTHTARRPCATEKQSGGPGCRRRKCGSRSWLLSVGLSRRKASL